MARNNEFKKNLLKPNYIKRKKRDVYRKKRPVKNEVFVPRAHVITLPENVKADVIICIHNALEDVKKCLESVLKANLSFVKQIILVNDASDFQTTEFLKKWMERHNRNMVLIELGKSPKGYTHAANAGLNFSLADVSILLNSDTIVCKDTFQKLLEPFYADKTVGIAGPLSNAAGPQSIPSTKRSDINTAINELPYNTSIDQIDKYCEAWSLGRNFPVVPLVHGFCFAIKKETLEKIGYFDEELFSNGYGEENDYCMRALQAGIKAAVATHTFVYHAKSKSYTDTSVRNKLMKKALSILRKKYNDRWLDAHTQTRNHSELVRIRREAQNLWNKKNAERRTKTNKTRRPHVKRIRTEQKVRNRVVKRKR